MLRLLPGVVVLVQKKISMQLMIDLYGIRIKNKTDLLKGLIKSTILRTSGYTMTLDYYLSGFLQDRDRSQLYYCDPMLQHLSICRHILSLLDGTNALDLQS